MDNMNNGKVYNITSHSNDRIKGIKTLWRKKNRNEQNCFLAEGRKIIQSAMDAKWNIKTFVCVKENDEDQKSLENLAAEIRQKGSDILFVNKSILTKITNRENAANCLAVIEQKKLEVESIEPKEFETWLALDRIRDTGNLGTTIRTCDALGIKGLVLVGECADLFALETVRASMGSMFNVQLYHTNQEKFIEMMQKWKKNGKTQIVTTHLKANVEHQNVEYDGKPNVIVIGNEQKGVSDEINKHSDVSVKIKMTENADSLNLAVATGIVLAQAQRNKL